MITIRYIHKLLQFGLGVWLLLACSELLRAVPHAATRNAKTYVKELRKKGLTALDLLNYHTASMTAILKVADTAGVGVGELARLSGIYDDTLKKHLRGKSILSNASISKLQAGLRQEIDNIELAEHSRQFHYELIDKLPQLLTIERAVVWWQKIAKTGELQDDDFYRAFVEDVIRVRDEGIADAVAFLQPKMAKPKDNDSKIAAVLHEYGITADDFDNYKVTSASVLQKIVKAAGTTYASDILTSSVGALSPHILGKYIVTDETIAKLRTFVTPIILSRAAEQQLSQDEAMDKIESVFLELDHALRVERAASTLRRKEQLLDILWKKRVKKVLVQHKKVSTTPERYGSSWEKINSYKQSSREIFLEITATLHQGGWLLPFNEGTQLAMFNELVRGEFVGEGISRQKLSNALQQTIAEEPVNTGTTKQATITKLKVLLSKFNAALRVEKALREMAREIDNFSPSLRQRVLKALAIRDEHLIITRFRVTWDDVESYRESSVTAIRELLTIFAMSSNHIAIQASLYHGTVSKHLIGRVNLSPTSNSCIDPFSPYNYRYR